MRCQMTKVQEDIVHCQMTKVQEDIVHCQMTKVQGKRLLFFKALIQLLLVEVCVELEGLIYMSFGSL